MLTTPLRPSCFARLFVFCWLAGHCLANADERSSEYTTRVKPLLAARCFACHGALKQEAGLRLDTVAAMRKGGESGAAFSVGKSGESELIRRVTDTNPDTRMPPEGEGGALSADEIATLKRWIDGGAIGPADEKPEEDPREHWAFRAPQRQPLPILKRPDWSTSPLDQFIAAEHDRHSLVPQPAADKRVLLRRLYLDLVGLPPTTDELEAFARDESVDAFDRVVERLLASPRHGERWGRHWMDVWRYSDWWGLGADVRNSQKHIWHWRDWIIESLNRDVPYDEMLRQMLAADELYPDDLEKLRATGFLVRHYFKFNRNTWLEGTMEHTFKAFMGMTINCSRCHDHKYDPISSQEYYRLRAFFEPYQVRTDQVPGEADYEKDGVPRVFDCHLDAPTYRFVRGDEKNPIKDQPLTPAVPALFAFDDLKITPVSLPAAAHQPGLRPWVLGNHLANAERQLKASRDAVEKARNVLAAATAAEASKPAAPPPSEPSIDTTTKKAKSAADVDELAALAVKPNATKPPTANVIASDDFVTMKPELWEQVSGQWRYDGKRAVQYQDIQERTALRLKKPVPTDFQATVKFAIIGGRTYRSVGMAFDAGVSHELIVYLSAFANDPKLQISYKNGGMNVYPPEGKVARPVKLDETQELTIRVRGQLINVELNGQHLLAWQTPMPRRTGNFELITFDAQAAYFGFEIAPLSPSIKLADGKATNAAGPVSKLPSAEIAAAELKVAELALAAAEMLAPVAQARAAADAAKLSSDAKERTSALARAAAQLEKQHEVLRAREAVAAAEIALLKAESTKKADAQKKLTAATDALQKAEKAAESPGEAYTSLTGALKTLESSVETDEERRRPFPTASTGRRAALAGWLTDARHPLTARVAVNHVWSRHFGRPLVGSVFEFGRKGTLPTHPALLDWLAVDFMDHGWDMKRLHRQMVTSRTYRLTSSAGGEPATGAAAANSTDSENRFYWRMNPTRMEAQLVRDSLLHLADELDSKMGGPPLDPVINEMARRRSLYFIHSHNDHHKFLSIFDDANVLECYRREQSIVPQQALALSNSKHAIESATKIVAAISASAGKSLTDEAFVDTAFEAVLATRPTSDERQACLEAMAAWQKILASEKAINVGTNVRANLIHALMNHNDFITIR